MTAKNKCPFCKQLAQLKELNERFHTLSVYKSALVDVGYYKQIDDDHCCGTTTFHFDLNFCPVCGRKLNITDKGDN